MSGGRHRGYTLRTSRGTGSYRSWERAVGAARWTAEVTKADTSIVNAPERRQRRDVGREARRSGFGPIDLGTATGRGFRTRPSRVTFPVRPRPPLCRMHASDTIDLAATTGGPRHSPDKPTSCVQSEGPVARTLARCACGLRPLLHVAVLPCAAVVF